MKRLFDEKDNWTGDSHQLDTETYQALKPIVEKYVFLGFSMRDIQYVMMSSVNDVCLSQILRNQETFQEALTKTKE